MYRSGRPPLPNFRGSKFQQTPNFLPRGCRSSPRYLTNTSETQDMAWRYWCETCDRGFHTQHLLDNHNNEHQRCNIEGCQFVAHPKMVTKHIQMQHSTGLYSKIAKLQNPEEVKKWREERKNKYPTKANIEKKKAEIKEKIVRGEKMELNNRYHNKRTDINMKRHQNIDNNYQHKKRYQNIGNNYQCKKKNFDNKYHLKKRNFNIANNTSSKSKLPKALCSSEGTKQVLKPFSGIQHILVENDVENSVEESDIGFQIEDDDDWAEDYKRSIQMENGTVCGALSTLMCNYGSSDEEGQKEACKSDKNVKAIDNNVQQKTFISNGNKNIESEDSGPEEEKIVKNLNNDENIVENKIELNVLKKSRVEYQRKPNINTTYKNKVPSTLLQKLLSKEIRQERNVVLQCIRHIVKNNYFNKNLNC